MEESTLGKDSSVPLLYHDLNDLRLISLAKKTKTKLRIKNLILGFPRIVKVGE